MNLGECYICTENNAPLSRCDCKNMYIHNNCLIKLIENKGSKCSVCLKEYNNVTVIIIEKKKLSGKGKMIYFLVFLNLNGLILSIYELFVYIYVDSSDLILTLTIIFFISSIMFAGYLSKVIADLINDNEFYKIIKKRVVTIHD